MSSTIQSPSVLTEFHDAHKGLRLFNAEHFRRTSASREQASNLSITTAQGDTITLSLNESREITRTTYNQFGRTPHEQIRVHQDSLTVKDNRALSIQVHGDLNEQELEDLQNVIHRVDQIVDDLLQGDLENAVNRALNLGNLSSIANLEANIEVRLSFSLEQQQIEEIEVNPESLSGLIERLRNHVNHGGIENIKLLQALDSAFFDYIRELSEEYGSKSPFVAITELIHNELVDALEDEHDNAAHVPS